MTYSAQSLQILSPVPTSNASNQLQNIRVLACLSKVSLSTVRLSPIFFTTQQAQGPLVPLKTLINHIWETLRSPKKVETSGKSPSPSE